jgi:hypothetical protein
MKDLWQPIKTAPQDGTRILGKFKTNNPDRRVRITHFCDIRNCWRNDELNWEYEIDAPIEWQPLPQ